MQWKTEVRELATLKSLEKNPNVVSEAEKEKLAEDLKTLGNFKPLVIDIDGTVLGGNHRYAYLLGAGATEVEVSVPERALTEEEKKKIIILDNQRRGEFDIKMLTDEYEDVVKSLGFDDLIPSFNTPEASKDSEYIEIDPSEIKESDNRLVQLLYTGQDYSDFTSLIEHFREETGLTTASEVILHILRNARNNS